jgi:hypothetical protein
MGTQLGQGLTVRLERDHAIGSEELDRLAARLRRELLELDVDDVRRATAGEAPEGARGLDAQSVGTLLVSLVTAPEALRAVVGVIRDWLGRSQARSAFLEIDGDVLHVTGLSSADQERLIEEWLSRRPES